MNRPVLKGFATVALICAAITLYDPSYVKFATGILVGAAALICATMFFVVLGDKKEKRQ